MHLFVSVCPSARPSRIRAASSTTENHRKMKFGEGYHHDTITDLEYSTLKIKKLYDLERSKSSAGLSDKCRTNLKLKGNSQR